MPYNGLRRMEFADYLDTRFSIPEDVVFELQEGFVIVNDNRFGTIFGLDPNASFFWQALAGDQTPRQTVEQVLSHCPATREEVEKDLAELLQRWMELKLVEPADPSPPADEVSA